MSSTNEATNVDLEKDNSVIKDGVDPDSLRTAVTDSNKISEEDSASVISCESESSASVRESKQTIVSDRIRIVLFVCHNAIRCGVYC